MTHLNPSVGPISSIPSPLSSRQYSPPVLDSVQNLELHEEENDIQSPAHFLDPVASQEVPPLSTTDATLAVRRSDRSRNLYSRFDDFINDLPLSLHPRPLAHNSTKFPLPDDVAPTLITQALQDS